MNRRVSLFLLCASFVLSAHVLPAQAKAVSEKEINTEIGKIRETPDDKRPEFETQIAAQIRALPAGLPKLKLADGLSHLVTEGDPGQPTIQAVADALSDALATNPFPANKDGSPSLPYRDLARLTHYEGASSKLADPQYAQADALLAANDAAVEKADFTLKDITGKEWTLSALRGKAVMVNFWATWCPPCLKEIPNLDAIYNYFQSKDQSLVVLSITDEDKGTVLPFMKQTGLAGIKYPVLLDPGKKVAKQFHVDGIPQTFLFDAKGKLVAHATDMRTQRQFLQMTMKAGLQPPTK